MEDLRECYVVSDSVAAALEPYVIFPERKARPIEQPVELNTADSATLRSVVGIGPRTVVAIMHYRERLGGFVRAEQLAEVPGVRERNYEKILKQIYCDSCKIRKIDINFASPKVLGKHPYIAPQALRKLLKARQLKGGWSTAGELVEQNILTREEAARLAPYLRFGTRSGADLPTNKTTVFGEDASRMRTPQFSERTNRFKTTKNKEYYDYHAGKRGRKHRARPEKVQT